MRESKIAVVLTESEWKAVIRFIRIELGLPQEFVDTAIELRGSIIEQVDKSESL